MNTVQHRRGAWRAPGSHLARLRDPADLEVAVVAPDGCAAPWDCGTRSPGGEPRPQPGAERNIDHQALSEIFFVEEIDAATHVALARTIEDACARELRALLQGSVLRARASRAVFHRREPIFGAARVAVTGWVEQLGERELVFRVVATAASVEVVDASLRFELVIADESEVARSGTQR